MEWQKIMKKQLEVNVSEDNFMLLPVWYNSKLKINNKSIFIKNWYQKGVKVLGDFFENEKLLTREQFQQKFDLNEICPLLFNGIKSTISKYLKSLHINIGEFKVINAFPYIPFHLNTLFPYDKGNRQLYSLLNLKETMPSAIIKWNSIDNFNLIVKEVFVTCFKTTADSSLQWLQFRILHRILPVGSYLKKIKVKVDDSCEFCGNESESIEHVFFNCTKISRLWRILSIKILEKTQILGNFNKRNILFGYQFF